MKISNFTPKEIVINEIEDGYWDLRGLKKELGEAVPITMTLVDFKKDLAQRIDDKHLYSFEVFLYEKKL